MPLLEKDYYLTLILSRARELSEGLIFKGGTCLNKIYYAYYRLSEDLDFTGGSHFSRESLSTMGKVLSENLYEKYGLNIKVSEPTKEIKNVDTWKIKVETRPEQKHLPAQRINIDICAVPSYEKQPMLLLNPYGVDMGTSGLIIQAQSREEIYADKLLAFALRPNRLKHRDLWDIVWLYQQGLKPRVELIPHKLRDRNLNLEDFITQFNARKELLKKDKKLSQEFNKEMRRFLSVEQENLWNFIIYLIDDLSKNLNLG